jgi:hypothetical protein
MKDISKYHCSTILLSGDMMAAEILGASLDLVENIGLD